LISVAKGLEFSTLRVISRITVVTIKKNRSINTISGKDAVEIAGVPPPLFFLNFDILS
jgi:hypothetical protein